MTIKPNRTDAYQFTIDMNSKDDLKSLKEFRKQFYGTNKYVKVQGRWGKNNPNYFVGRNAWGGDRHFTPLNLAQYGDVYVYDR